MDAGNHFDTAMTLAAGLFILLCTSCAGVPVSDHSGRRPAIAVDESLSAPDSTTAIAWVERNAAGRLFVMGKVFDTHLSSAMERAPRRTLVGPIAGDFTTVESVFGLTLTRTPGGYFLTWSDGPLLFGRFWNETLTATRSERLSFTPRATTSPDQVEAVYDPHRRRVLVVWRSGLALFTGTVSAARPMLIRTGVTIASQALHFDVAANLKRPASPAYLVSYVTGRDLRDREVRSFTLSGPALGTLTKSAEKLITMSEAPTQYELVAVSFNNPFNGLVTVFTHGEQIEAVAQDHLGEVEKDYDLGSRRVFYRRVGATASIRHPETWYDIDCPINPNGLAALFLTQTTERPTERFAELHLYARSVRGLGTSAGVTLGSERLLESGSTDPTRSLHFQGGVRAGWNGAFEFVWERIVRDGELDTVLHQEALFGAVNSRVEVVN